MLDLKDGRTFVIAEAGTAHESCFTAWRLEKAMALVEMAAAAKADAIKFQWFDNPNPRTMFCWLDGDEARSERWLRSAMSRAEWAEVKGRAEALGLVFLASAFEPVTVQWLIDLGVVATKVASRAAKNFPYDTEGLPWPVLVSNGMGDPPLTIFPPGEPYMLLQCEAKYPSTREWLRGSHGAEGFSDHSGKPFLGIDAISRGCPILEVHFQGERQTMFTGRGDNWIDSGPDKPAAVTLDELRFICEARDYYAARTA